MRLKEFSKSKTSNLESRWKGGRATKLEGSDHVPVFVTLKDIPDIQMHCTPPLSARYMPEIRGSQQTIVSILMKRQLSEKIGVLASPSTKQDTKNLKVEGSVEGALYSCSVSNTHLNTSSPSMMNSCENDPSTSDLQDVATVGRQLIGSVLDVPKKKKPKQNQQSQLSLKSFFCKIPNSGENVENSTRSVSENLESSSNSPDCAKVSTENANKKGKLDESANSQEHNTLTDYSLGSEKKTAALMEWQRIQQLMQDSIPLCEGHHEPCVSRVVKKPGSNFGRRFYVCARAEGPASNPEARCDFFRWAGTKSKQKK